MRRSRTILVAVVSATLTLLLLAPATAARKKPAPAVPKASAAPGSDPGSAAGGDPEKNGTGTPLDLPLPADASGAATEKKDAESSPSAAKPAPASKPDSGSPAKDGHSSNATIQPETIAEFAAQTPRIQQLIQDAINLTRLNLGYAAGSADPDNGGMDASGAIYYLLRAHRFGDVPREAGGQYLWARKNGAFFPVVKRSDDSVEFNELLPGDLLFWAGSEASDDREVPISHVMLYLGREKETGHRIIFGASEGRDYRGIQRRGVSVFDFTIPKAAADGPEKGKTQFVGFARIPGLRSGGSASVAEGAAVSGVASKSAANPSAKSSPKKKRKSKK